MYVKKKTINASAIIPIKFSVWGAWEACFHTYVSQMSTSWGNLCSLAPRGVKAYFSSPYVLNDQNCSLQFDGMFFNPSANFGVLILGLELTDSNSNSTGAQFNSDSNSSNLF